MEAEGMAVASTPPSCLSDSKKRLGLREDMGDHAEAAGERDWERREDMTRGLVNELLEFDSSINSALSRRRLRPGKGERPDGPDMLRAAEMQTPYRSGICSQMCCE
jgi:hypothetical protein